MAKLEYTKAFDLSHPVYNNCPQWETYENTDVRLEAKHPTHGFLAERIDINSHCATHLDAPFHFIPHGISIDKMQVDLFQGECVIIDCTNIEPAHAIGLKELEPYSEKIHEGSIVMTVTGWGEKRGFSNIWYHDYPYLSQEGAQWLRDKKIKGYCIDTLSTGAHPKHLDNGIPHAILLGADIWLLEDFVVPRELLKYETCQLFCFPLHLQNFGASPTRAVAFV